MATKQTSRDSAVYLRGADVQKIIVPMTFETTDLQDGDQHIMCELPDGAIITSIKAINDVLDGVASLAFDVGLWYTNKGLDLDELSISDLTLIDVDEYVDGDTSFQAATTELSEIMNGRDPADIYTTVRENAGDSIGELPFKYVMVMEITVTAATATAGDATFVIEYVQG